MENQENVENLKREVVANAGINPVEYAGLIRWQLESSDVISDTYDWLRGMQLVQEKNSWVKKQLGKVYCNEEGASAIASMLYMYLNKNVTLSNFSEKRINAIMLELADSIVSFLAYFQPKFEIDPGDLTIIKNVVCDMIEANLWRAYQMETFKGQQASHHSVEEYRKEKEKKPTFPFPNFMKRSK
jgi:hypothetical protein